MKWQLELGCLPKGNLIERAINHPIFSRLSNLLFLRESICYLRHHGRPVVFYRVEGGRIININIDIHLYINMQICFCLFRYITSSCYLFDFSTSLLYLFLEHFDCFANEFNFLLYFSHLICWFFWNRVYLSILSFFCPFFIMLSMYSA